MALTTVDDVLSLLSLIPELFDFTGVTADADLDAIVTTAIDDARIYAFRWAGPRPFSSRIRCQRVSRRRFSSSETFALLRPWLLRS